MAVGDAVRGFEVLGPDGRWRSATATIEKSEGSYPDTVLVRATDVDRPRAVRYGWRDAPENSVTLFRDDGMPVLPFRSYELRYK